MIWLAVFIGGGLGSLLRFFCSSLLFHFLNVSWPSILLVNILGSLSIFLLANKLTISGVWWYFLIIGVLGGFTTFSSFSYEAFILLKQKQYLIFSLFVGLNMLVGIGAGVLLIKEKL